jgi:hypothetical protein
MVYSANIEGSNPYRTKTDNTPWRHRLPKPTIEYRGFRLVREPDYQLWEISRIDGTRTPTVLSGRYTNPRIAEEQIDNYLASQNRKQKGKKEEITNAYDSKNYS